MRQHIRSNTGNRKIRTETSSPRQFLQRALVSLCIVGIFLWLFLMNGLAMYNFVVLAKQAKQSDSDLIAIQNKEYDTALGIRYHMSDAYIEKRAREDFSMSRKNDTIVVAYDPAIVQENSTTASSQTKGSTTSVSVTSKTVTQNPSSFPDALKKSVVGLYDKVVSGVERLMESILKLFFY